MDFYSALIESYNLLKKRQLKLVVEEEDSKKTGTDGTEEANNVLTAMQGKQPGEEETFPHPDGTGKAKATVSQDGNINVKFGQYSRGGLVIGKTSTGKGTGGGGGAAASLKDLATWFSSTKGGVPETDKPGHVPATSLEPKPSYSLWDRLGNILGLGGKPLKNKPKNYYTEQVEAQKLIDKFNDNFDTNLSLNDGSKSLEGRIGDMSVVSVDKDGSLVEGDLTMTGRSMVDYLRSFNSLLRAANGEPKDEDCARVKETLRWQEGAGSGKAKGRYFLVDVINPSDGVRLPDAGGTTPLATLMKEVEKKSSDWCFNTDNFKKDLPSVAKVTGSAGDINNIVGKLRERTTSFINNMAIAMKSENPKAQKLIEKQMKESIAGFVQTMEGALDRMKDIDITDIKTGEVADAVEALAKASGIKTRDREKFKKFLLLAYKMDDSLYKETEMGDFEINFNTGTDTGIGKKKDNVRATTNKEEAVRVAKDLGVDVVEHTLKDIKKLDKDTYEAYKALNPDAKDDTVFYGIGIGDKFYATAGAVVQGSTSNMTTISKRIQGKGKGGEEKFIKKIVDKFGFDRKDIKSYDNKLQELSTSVENVFGNPTKVTVKNGKVISYGQSKELDTLLKNLPKGHSLRNMLDKVDWNDERDLQNVKEVIKTHLLFSKVTTDAAAGSSEAKQWLATTMYMTGGSSEEELMHVGSYRDSKHYAVGHNEPLTAAIEGVMNGSWAVTISEKGQTLSLTDNKTKKKRISLSAEHGGKGTRHSLEANKASFIEHNKLKSENVSMSMVEDSSFVLYLEAHRKMLAEFLQPE